MVDLVFWGVQVGPTLSECGQSKLLDNSKSTPIAQVLIYAQLIWNSSNSKELAFLFENKREAPVHIYIYIYIYFLFRIQKPHRITNLKSGTFQMQMSGRNKELFDSKQSVSEVVVADTSSTKLNLELKR